MASSLDDSNEYMYTQHTIINIKRKSPSVTPNLKICAPIGCLPSDKRRVPNSRGKRAIGVQAIEVLLNLNI